MKTTKRNRNDSKRCERWQALLLEDLEGTLGADESRDLEEHLARCERCVAEKAALTESLAILSERRPADPGEAFWTGLQDRVREGLEEPVREPRIARWSWAPAAAAAALLVLFVAWWVNRPQELAPRGGSLLAELEMEAKRELASLSVREAEIDELQLADASEETLTDLLGDLAGDPGRIHRALLRPERAEDRAVWVELAAEEQMKDLSLDDLIGQLTESELEKLADRLEKLMG